MKAAAVKRGTLVAIVLAMAVPALSEDTAEPSAVTDRDRVFRNYVREAATVGNGMLRLELRGYHSEDEHRPDIDVLGYPVADVERQKDATVIRNSGGVIDLLGSYGLGPNAEVGFDIPYVLEKFRLEDAAGAQRSLNEEDIGDILLYLKVKRQIATNCRIGAGVELTPPTGPERKFLGTGEIGLNPFVSTRYQNGRFSAGLHVGYLLYTGDVSDELNYSAQFIARGSALFALRLEFSGRHFKAFNRTYDDVLVFPGVDVNITDTITIRPTGIFNITDESQDWGVGVGIAGQLPVI